MAKTTLYLVRHGESIGNKMGIILGHTDLDLTELGYIQAQKTADALRDVDFCAIYSSDLMRALNTAKQSARLHNLDVIPDEKLREIYLGDWEGIDKNVLVTEYADLFYNGWHNSYGMFVVPNGESIQGSAQRVYNELELIAKRHEGKTVLATLHAAVIRSFWSKISGLPAEEWADAYKFPSNASYTIVEYEDGKFTPISYSNDEHMGELITEIKF